MKEPKTQAEAKAWLEAAESEYDEAEWELEQARDYLKEAERTRAIRKQELEEAAAAYNKYARAATATTTKEEA